MVCIQFSVESYEFTNYTDSLTSNECTDVLFKFHVNKVDNKKKELHHQHYCLLQIDLPER